ncbi:MAG: ATP-binding cassette domain-containing protein, partial [Hoeflea sp.]|nr:ATP-binding cassette domain-containing protein [Hoeflea sp.]
MTPSATLEALAKAGIPAPVKPLLTVENLTRVYGKRIGCADVSFDLWPGEVLAIVGESGSGKTTLLNCISS